MNDTAPDVRLTHVDPIRLAVVRGRARPSPIRTEVF
jgi:hypothetical protein